MSTGTPLERLGAVRGIFRGLERSCRVLRAAAPAVAAAVLLFDRPISTASVSTRLKFDLFQVLIFLKPFYDFQVSLTRLVYYTF